MGRQVAGAFLEGSLVIAVSCNGREVAQGSRTGQEPARHSMEASLLVAVVVGRLPEAAEWAGWASPGLSWKL